LKARVTAPASITRWWRRAIQATKSSAKTYLRSDGKFPHDWGKFLKTTLETIQRSARVERGS
jgi:hypothetical protein